MPQVDLETLVCGGGGGGDGRVACESLAPPHAVAPPKEDPDFPAESYQVAIGDEIDWTDVNAVYDRDDSTKGNTNPKSQHSNPNKPPSNSQRFSGNLKPKAPIIGLPGKIQHSGYLGRSGRRPANGRIFPKKGAAARGGRKAAVESEPASPKVSCIGKVLSERERDRLRRARRKSADGKVEEEEEEHGGGGCWAVFLCFGGGKRRARTVECVEESPEQPSRELAPPRASVERESGPPGLGGMKRFASGRRPASWGGDADADVDGRVAFSGPLDRDGMWGRRSVGSLEDAEL